jgi:hypothetical protein
MLVSSIGGLIIALALGLNIRNLIFDSSQIWGIIYIFILSIGIIVLSAGINNDPIPLKPKIKKFRKRRIKVQSIVLLLLPLTTLFSMGALLSHVYKKVKIGLSKEFTFFLVSLLFFAVFLLFEYTLILFPTLVTSLITNPEQIVTIQIVRDVLLFLTGMSLLYWVSRFLAFRSGVSLFFSVWQILIIGSILLNSFFAYSTLTNTESQLNDLLNKNSKLITFTLDQVRKSNLDVISSLTTNDQFVKAVEDKNGGYIQSNTENLLRGNISLDSIIITDAEAIIVYDSRNPAKYNESISSNGVIKKALLELVPQNGFIRDLSSIEGYALNYWSAIPILKEGKLIGIISSMKSINNSYLDLVKKQTGQELLLYVDNTRKASTIIDPITNSRLENIPADPTDNDGSIAQISITGKPYYMASIDLPVFGTSFNDRLLVGTEQQLLFSSSQKTLILSFLGVIIFCIISIVPILVISKRLYKEQGA